MGSDYTKTLAAFDAGLRYDDLPPALVKKLKENLLDQLGCAVAGYDAPELARARQALAGTGEKGPAMLWGGGQRLPYANALLLNGMACHAMELDDLHKPSKIHAACVVWSPVLTLGETLKSSGRAALTAAAAGYETAIRVSMALGTASHRRRGWHATATCGSFGAAAAAGSLLGLDAADMASALGLAGTQTGGLMAYTADGSMSKRLHAGKAGENGYTAAALAKAGFRGPTYVLEASDGGYAHAASDDYDLDVIEKDLGRVFFAQDTGVKFYACCGHIHQAIDAGLQLLRENALTAGDVAAVRVKTYDVSGMTWGFAGAPKNAVEAQFSIPYAVAAALTDGEAFVRQFSPERMNDPAILDLAARVTVETCDEYTRRYPAQWCSAAELTLRDGRVLQREVCGARGDPSNPLTPEELTAKFRALTARRLSPARQDAVIRAALELQTLSDVGELVSLLRFEKE